MAKVYRVEGFKKYENDFGGVKKEGHLLSLVAVDTDPNFIGKEYSSAKVGTKTGYIPKVGDNIKLFYGSYNGVKYVEEVLVLKNV